ncbi:hypothetical protein N8D56_05815 [Devosia sp. A8/3-2]|nr:hypothetical protein N8D56_05815 [Devosia sp. A8/3-2]
MKRFLIGASLVGMLAATPALADGKIYVQLPDLSGITGTEAEQFLHQSYWPISYRPIAWAMK